MNYQLLLILSVVLPLVDSIYLSRVSSHFTSLVKKITKENLIFNLPKAVGAYLFLILGLYYFILKDITEENLKDKIISAMILGWVIYGTFDFTTGAIFKEYDWNTMILDTTWGGVLYGLVTYITFKLVLVLET
ncbi:hypothetical protein crov425 [Cafeteria roenbergensis virus]|uniref:DUF2177 domain-containing protein n=1 Tax=Cafeteria roenbergensis virus (strain BV-PW1) TaxID=693272 RepID=E3T5J6_CROVB|nr:hypothetical protein crov425 [Cafeteria roenbergensis virus BV-PW1]ADO67459.1 hypothetical protein crov425 [Cafeteria roenbergensis virus BV-PW1]